MNDTTVPQGTDAPSTPVAPAVAAPVVQPAPPTVPKVDMTPAQLKERLDEERAKAAQRAQEAFAKDLGVDLETAKKLIAEARAKEEAQKSEVQKLTEQLQAERAKLARLPVLEETIGARATVELAALTDAQRAAVETLAGKDPAAQLKAIDALKPTWAAAKAEADALAQAAAVKAVENAKAAAEAAKPATPAAPPKIPAGASTTPATPPPPPAQPGVPTNHLAVWEDMKIKNPAAAARYRVQHEAAIRAAQKQQPNG